MMPKFGNLTNPSEDILEEIEKIGRMGFDFAEISIEGPKSFPDNLRRKRKDILRILRKYRMFAIGHTMWWCDLGSPYENVRKGWVEEAKSSIDIANELGIKLVNFHFESVQSLFRDNKIRKKILNNYVRSMKELVEYGKIKGVDVMLENCVSEGCSHIDNYGYIVNRVKGLGVHLDVGHAFIEGGTKNVLKFITTFRKRLVHIHMHDNYGDRDDHLPLGIARVEYDKVARALKKIGYSKTVTFEVFTMDRDFAALSMKKFRDAWKGKK